MSSSLSTIPGLLPLPVFIEEADAHPEEATWAEISPSVVLKTPEEFSAAIAPLAIPEEWQFAEAYILTISAGSAQVTAASELGLSRGLRRLNTLAIANHSRAPIAVKIIDYPAYKHRGLHIDVARHFFSVPTILRVMDAMSEVGLNILHLHLSDDQGWRIEIPQFPELIERSSDCAVGGEEGGYYTLDDYQTLVEGARSRMIAIIPEIDIPGHVNAALHAIEGLNPDGVCPPLYEGTEVGFSTLSTKAPATQAFLEAVVETLAPFSPAVSTSVAMNPSLLPKVIIQRLLEAKLSVFMRVARALWRGKKPRICWVKAILFRCGMTILKETRSLVLSDAE